eukprot:Rhum_TRINITY_DN14357_c33_g1::Rhum_TRINITY_DN14357_c33_g1_i1::g.84289::m.84289
MGRTHIEGKASILICGDGNFSFSQAIARLQKHGEHDLLARLVGREAGPFDLHCTSFDTRTQLLSKYPECAQILDNLAAMSACAVSVEHGVNAWELPAHFPGRLFDVVLWNHPHLGTENFNLHRFLLSHFMHSAEKVLRPGGSIVLSVLSGQASRWCVQECGERLGLVCVEKTLFVPSNYPGYETRRNRTANSFQNVHTQEHTGDALKSVSLRFQRPEDARKTKAAAAAAAAAEAAAAAAAAAALAPTPAPKPEEIPLRPAENQFFCKVCGKGFKKAQAVFTHTKQVHEYKKYGDGWTAEGKGIGCRICDKKFPNDEAVWQHEIAVHTEDVNIPHPSRDGDVVLTPAEEAKTYGYFPCEVCGMSVSRHPDWGMAAHLESLKPIVGLEIPCGFEGCSKVFIEQRALRQHRNFCRVKSKEEREVAAAAAAAPTEAAAAADKPTPSSSSDDALSAPLLTLTCTSCVAQHAGGVRRGDEDGPPCVLLGSAALGFVAGAGDECGRPPLAEGVVEVVRRLRASAAAADAPVFVVACLPEEG